MYAVIRESTYDVEKKAGASKQLEEFARIRAQQPGYCGALTLDVGDGRTLTVNLWETKEQQQAASAKVTPEAERLMGPLWTTPPQVIGSGEVIHNDIAKS